MTSSELLADAFTRIREEVRDAVDGLSVDELTHRVAPGANTIAWLVWHLTRIQDDHVAGAFGTEQVWTAASWNTRFALPFHAAETGYAQTAADVDAVRAPAELLAGYHDAVCDQTLRLVADVTDDDLPRIVDRSYDPPVTLAVRLVSVISDDLQHVGQAAFVRGVLPGSAVG